MSSAISLASVASSSIAIAAEFLMLAGSEAQKQRWLPALASGEAIGTLALVEGPGKVPEATIDATVSNGALTGVKSPVADGDIADFAIVAARDEAGATSLYLVELKAAGVRVADTLPGLIDTPILPDEAKVNAPTEGMWRLTPPREVAEAVWGAYHTDKIHWYVPSELEAYDLVVTQHPEMIRDQMAQAGLFNPPQE